MVQWNDLGAGRVAERDFIWWTTSWWFPDRPEWAHLADLADYTARPVNNAGVANNSLISGIDYTYLDSRFMCARPQVDTIATRCCISATTTRELAGHRSGSGGHR